MSTTDDTRTATLVAPDTIAALTAALARAEQAERERDRLRAVILRAGLWQTAPCCLCGYNGPGYYQPGTHDCARAALEDVKR
jgi:hypothetical protein